MNLKRPFFWFIVVLFLGCSQKEDSLLLKISEKSCRENGQWWKWQYTKLEITEAGKERWVRDTIRTEIFHLDSANFTETDFSKTSRDFNLVLQNIQVEKTVPSFTDSIQFDYLKNSSVLHFKGVKTYVYLPSIERKEYGEVYTETQKKLWVSANALLCLDRRAENHRGEINLVQVRLLDYQCGNQRMDSMDFQVVRSCQSYMDGHNDAHLPK